MKVFFTGTKPSKEKVRVLEDESDDDLQLPKHKKLKGMCNIYPSV